MLKARKVEEWLKTQMQVSASLLGSLDTNFFENISCNRVDLTKARLDPLLAIIVST